MKMYHENGVIFYGKPKYDWVSSHGSRTPAQYPYSHDEYYVWRDFDKGDRSVEFYYTDRMRSWDADKYQRATKDRLTNFGSVPKSEKAAQEIVSAYFGSEYECVGIIQSINVSNGYPLGVFCVRKTGEAQP